MATGISSGLVGVKVKISVATFNSNSGVSGAMRSRQRQYLRLLRIVVGLLFRHLGQHADDERPRDRGAFVIVEANPADAGFRVLGDRDQQLAAALRGLDIDAVAFDVGLDGPASECAGGRDLDGGAALSARGEEVIELGRGGKSEWGHGQNEGGSDQSRPKSKRHKEFPGFV